jgi:hypothetical protein
MKKIRFYLVNQSKNQKIAMKTGFSWEMFFWSWLGYILFKRRLFVLGFISVSLSIVYCYMMFAAVKSVTNSISSMSNYQSSIESLHKSPSVDFPYKTSLDISIFAFSIFCSIFGNVLTVKKLVKAGWVIVPEKSEYNEGEVLEFLKNRYGVDY